MKKVFFFLLVGWLWIPACEHEESKHDKPFERFRDIYGRGMVANHLARFQMSAYYNEARSGSAFHYGLFIPVLYGYATVSSDSASQDTAYYDPSTGFWIYAYSDSCFTMSIRYRFLPADSMGLPTTATDSCLYEYEYNGHFFADRMLYRYDGQSSLSLSGLCQWNDNARLGELIFWGASVSNSEQIFSPDTNVLFRTEENTHGVRLKENDCIPRSGYITFRMTQNATPDSFMFFPDWYIIRNYDGFAFTDFDLQGEIRYEPRGIRWIMGDEEYFWKIDCNELWGLFGFRKTPAGFRR